MTRSAQDPLRTEASRSRHLPVRRATLTSALVGGLVLVPLSAAEAHVTVHPDTTTAGAESAEMTFRVPTESDTASTVSVELHLPTTNPLAEVLARPISGWTVKVTDGTLPTPVVVDGTTLTEAPITVTWTATSPDARVGPGQYQDFTIQAGPLPKTGDVTFTATQTYSDRTVVQWNQPEAAGQAEPEHPAPSFAITPASTAAGASATGTTTVEPGAADPTARWLGGGGLVLGAIALVIALTGRRRQTTRPEGLAG